MTLRVALNFVYFLKSVCFHCGSGVESPGDDGAPDDASLYRSRHVARICVSTATHLIAQAEELGKGGLAIWQPSIFTSVFWETTLKYQLFFNRIF